MDRCSGYDCSYNGGYGQVRCKDKQHCGAYYEQVPFTLCLKDRVGDDIFLTEEEARKKVEKLNKKK